MQTRRTNRRHMHSPFAGAHNERIKEVERDITTHLIKFRVFACGHCATPFRDEQLYGHLTIRYVNLQERIERWGGPL